MKHGYMVSTFSVPDSVSPPNGDMAIYTCPSGSDGVLCPMRWRDLLQKQRVMTDAADEIDAANAHDDASGRSNSHGFGRINIGRALGGL